MSPKIYVYWYSSCRPMFT